mmetsp:Transcript_4240/g.8482  ORF Transcript_4240/g.8482 Transcript_4240/m.8482 type:complete len:307 (+) Transcript_4240:795-1715(+)
MACTSHGIVTTSATRVHTARSRAVTSSVTPRAGCSSMPLESRSTTAMKRQCRQQRSRFVGNAMFLYIAWLGRARLRACQNISSTGHFVHCSRWTMGNIALRSSCESSARCPRLFASFLLSCTFRVTLSSWRSQLLAWLNNSWGRTNSRMPGCSRDDSNLRSCASLCKCNFFCTSCHCSLVSSTPHFKLAPPVLDSRFCAEGLRNADAFCCTDAGDAGVIPAASRGLPGSLPGPCTGSASKAMESSWSAPSAKLLASPLLLLIPSLRASSGGGSTSDCEGGTLPGNVNISCDSCGQSHCVLPSKRLR